MEVGVHGQLGGLVGFQPDVADVCAVGWKKITTFTMLSGFSASGKHGVYSSC